jgi:hypothetical protein
MPVHRRILVHEAAYHALYAGVHGVQQPEMDVRQGRRSVNAQEWLQYVRHDGRRQLRERAYIQLLHGV